jgi:hypothetical protein
MEPATDKPLMQYASHVSAGTGRTPIGIVLIACSHLLLGALVEIWIVAVIRQLNRISPLGWTLFILAGVGAAAMIVGALALLLKGRTAWTTALASFIVLATAEGVGLCFATRTLVHSLATRENRRFLLFIATAELLLTFQFWLCSVVLRYLSRAKARATFALPSGEFPPIVRWMPRVIVMLTVLAAVVSAIGGATDR